jgi:UDP-N-acetylglucosamine--N-acetylmuramyl-(pentapeptide) pyrophosphoryl-undecaprenol N-acetylglucosamine transferase
MSARPVIIMAGGTGGHVFPALALARLLRERSCEVVWLGTRRGLEARREVLEAFPGSFGAGVPARTVGNPVRADIAAIAAPAERFAGKHGRTRLLVFGGSQGAQRLNAVVPQALSRLDPARRIRK